MTLGYTTSGFTLIVPPHLDTFELEGGCSADCLGGVSRIRVFYIELRMVLLNYKIPFC